RSELTQGVGIFLASMPRTCETSKSRGQRRSPREMSKNTLKSNFASASVACDFCDEFAGGLRNAFAKLYGDLIQARTLVATKEFRVIPSLGQIVEGYLLVVPAKHYATL